MAQLAAIHRRHIEASSRLRNLIADAASLTAEHQRLLGELVVIRLFSLTAWLLEATAARLLSGVPYLDGTKPTLLYPSRNVAASLANMKKHGRKKPLPYLKWNSPTDIVNNVKFLLDPNDHFLTALGVHAAFIEEMRHVRNHIAHNTSSTGTHFRAIVKAYYGAYVNSVTPGVLLVSTRHNPRIINQYLTKSTVAVSDLLCA